MKKTLCFILLMALVCALLAGCHGSKDQQAFAIPDEFDDSIMYDSGQVVRIA